MTMRNAATHVFERVGALNPRRSVFDLSYEKKFTCDMGQLIPVQCDECIPGDIITIGNTAVVRFMPLVAPIMHEINMITHTFFVPYRLLWSEWSDFITGGEHGDNTSTLPRWTPTNCDIGSLWDYLGFPTSAISTDWCKGSLPMSFPRDAYNLIYNEYYRDENLINKVALTQESILNSAWEPDYFTKSLPWVQKGIAPSLPISGTTVAQWPSSQFSASAHVDSGIFFNSASSDSHGYVNSTDPDYVLNARAFMNSNSVDLSSATTFNVSDLRLAFQTQKWMERNARGGTRYTESLRAHFGISPRDETLQRPAYIGGTRSPIIISEVLQTSATETGQSAQGNLAGHGVTVSQSLAGKYRVEEHGLIMTIMRVVPKPAYQQGINRQWLRTTKYDFFWPEFANLSEQAVTRSEIYCDNNQTNNNTIFGYQGRYNEMRTKPNQVCGLMRNTFNYWHLGRSFSSAPALNETFITINPTTLKRVFAVQNQPGLMVQFGNLIKAIRPIPIQAEPGLIDHN